MSNERILLIDDTPVLAQGIADMLRMEGFVVTVCHTGREAVSFLEQNVVNLVITDLRMPEMDGLEITRTIRNNERLHKVPVIILTADTDPENDRRSNEAGANLLLHKPFDEEHLLECIYQITQDE